MVEQFARGQCGVSGGGGSLAWLEQNELSPMSRLCDSRARGQLHPRIAVEYRGRNLLSNCNPLSISPKEREET